ncbi:MAG: hypothetical protein ACLQIB_21015 [Isosphaeraceae bacterium]
MEPFSDEGSAHCEKYRHRERVNPPALQDAVEDILEPTGARAAQLTPGNGHRSAERYHKATEKQGGRTRDRLSRNDKRDQRRPEWKEIEDACGYEGMGAAQTNIVQKQTRYSNDEQNGQFAPVAHVEKNHGEIAPTGRADREQRDGKQQADLCQADKLGRCEASGRKRGKRLLNGEKNCGSQ